MVHTGLDPASEAFRDRSWSLPPWQRLIVFGVLAVLIVTVTSSQRAYAGAVEAVAAAETTEDSIVATAALQNERALASSLADADLYMYHSGYDASIVDTDRGMQALRASWAEHRSEISETATPSIGDVLSADGSLADFREAALSTSGESTYPLYSEMVATSVAATSELIQQSSDSTTLEDRSLLVALLGLAESLNTQRFLIQEALVTGGPVSEEMLLQLEVESDNLNQSFFEARSLADGDDLTVIEGIRTGEASQEVVQDGGTGHRPWGSGRIDQPAAMVRGQYGANRAGRCPHPDGPRAGIHSGRGGARQCRGRVVDCARSSSVLYSSSPSWSAATRCSPPGSVRRRWPSTAQLSDGLRQWFAPTNFPDPESVEIAARYIPASVRTQSGGDWYDVYEVGNSLAVVIGDVAGHGADATAQMAQLRNILRGQSTARTLDPAAQIDLLDKTMTGSGIVATVTYGLLDVSSGEFVYTRAGHVPLLVRSAAGDVRIEEEAQGPPVGGEVDLKREIKRTRLHPGDVLILITDGLVEGLNRDIDEALDQIAKALTEADSSTEAMLDQLFGMKEEEPIDDAAALLITWNPPSQVT